MLAGASAALIAPALPDNMIEYWRLFNSADWITPEPDDVDAGLERPWGYVGRASF
jgi:hypothetical protein